MKEQAHICGCEGFLPEFPQTFPNNFWATFHFLYEYFLMKIIFRMTSKKNLHLILGAIFFKSKHVGHDFCSYFQGVCPDFPGFCEDFTNFAQISTDFARIFKDFAWIFTK